MLVHCKLQYAHFLHTHKHTFSLHVTPLAWICHPDVQVCSRSSVLNPMWHHGRCNLTRWSLVSNEMRIHPIKPYIRSNHNRTCKCCLTAAPPPLTPLPVALEFVKTDLYAATFDFLQYDSDVLLPTLITWYPRSRQHSGMCSLSRQGTPVKILPLIGLQHIWHRWSRQMCLLDAINLKSCTFFLGPWAEHSRAELKRKYVKLFIDVALFFLFLMFFHTCAGPFYGCCSPSASGSIMYSSSVWVTRVNNWGERVGKILQFIKSRNVTTVGTKRQCSSPHLICRVGRHAPF